MADRNAPQKHVWRAIVLFRFQISEIAGPDRRATREAGRNAGHGNRGGGVRSRRDGPAAGRVHTEHLDVVSRRRREVTRYCTV